MVSLNSPDVQLKFHALGGRIISLRAFGEELLFAGEIPAKAPELPRDVEGADWRAFKRYFGFRLLGGDKTWIAPEAEWLEKIPPLDLDAAAYRMELQTDRIVMSSPVCRETGLRVERAVSLDVAGIVQLREEIINEGKFPVTRGIWNVSQLARPFTAWFPGDSKNFRSYHLQDPSLPVPSIKAEVSAGMIGIPCAHSECYKFGGMPFSGRCLTVKPLSGGHIIWSRHFGFNPSLTYAHASAVEVFNSAVHDYGEVEIHSPLYCLAPGERMALEQRWSFFHGAGEPDIHSLY